MYAAEDETVYRTETVYNDRTGLPIRQLTTLNGMLQSPPDDTPAQVLFDEHGRVREMVWWHRGKEHRDPSAGPAVIKLNPKNGVHAVERYKMHGETSRSRNEPALIVRHPDTGEIELVEYYVHGVRVTAHSNDIDPRP